MSYGAGEEPTNRLPSVFKRLGSLPVTAATANISNMNEQPVHMYSEPPPSSNGPMGIRIASRPTYFQQRAPPPQAAYYPQATPMYNSMNYSSASIAPQVSTSSFYNGHPRSLRNAHEYIPPSSSGSPSISMVPSPSENGSLHFGHDVSTIKNPATNRQIYSFLGNNSQPTPYHYNPYQEEEIQWGNKNIVHVARNSNNSNRSESQISSPTSSSSSEVPRYRKGSRLDMAKNIQIVSYKKPAVVSSSVATTDIDDDDMDGSNDDDSSQEHSPVIRKVIVASNENRSYSSSSERKNSGEDRRRPVHSRQSSSGENESKVRKGDYYVPDYDKRPLPPKAPLTKGVRRTNRSPDRQQRSRRTLSRSPSLSPDRYRRSSRRSSRSSSRSSSRGRSRSRSYTRSISISLSLSPSRSRSRSRSLSPSRRSRSRSASPERYQRRPRRNSSRSPSRQDSIRSNSSSTTTSTNINDRLNLDKVAANVVTAMTTGSISTTSSNSNSNNNNNNNNHSRQSSDSSGVSVRYQNKTWVNTNEKLPLSKKFTSKEQQQQQFSGESAVPKKAVMDKAKSQFSPAAPDGAHGSYNKIWVNSNSKSSNNPSSSSSSSSPVTSSLSNSKKPQQETKRRDLRYQQPIISEPLPPSKKFSNQSKPAAPLTKPTTPASSASSAIKPQTANTVASTKQVKSTGSASVPAKSNEKSKVVDNKQKSTTATATTATSTKTVITKAASTSSLPKAPTPVKANNDQNKQRATTATTTSTATNASNAVARTATAPAGTPEVKIPVKKQVGCFKTTLKKVGVSKVEPNTELMDELCPIKVEQDTEHKMMMNLKKDKTDNMETDSVVGNHNGSNGSSTKRNLLPDTLTNTTVDTVIDTPMTEQTQNITEKRLADVPELVQSKKRKVQATPPRIVEESDAMDTDYVESPLDDPMLSVTNDSLQNNGNATESTCSSSSSSLSSVTDTHLSETDTLAAVPSASVKSTSHTFSKESAQVAEDSSPIPMVVDPPSSPKATDPSSNRLNVPMVIPASNESTVSSTRSTPSQSVTNRDVYEKEDILEQIFGESSSRDVTPEFHQAPSSVNKTIHLSESVAAAAATGGNGGKSKHVNKSHIVTKTSDPEAAVASTKFGNITSPAIESSTISPAMTKTKNILNTTTIHADANNKPETAATVPIATSGQKANDTLLLHQATHDNLSNGSSKMSTLLDQSLDNASVPESANVATSQTQETNGIADHHNNSNTTHSSSSTRSTPTIITTTTTIEKSAIPSSSSPTSSLPSPPVAATPTRRRPKSRILPKPWVIRMHDTGEMYFFNMETGESSDVRPVI